MTDDPVTDPPTRRARCSVCRDPRKPDIHALKASGMTLQQIEDALREGGKPIKRETIGLHFRICLGGRAPTLDDTVALNAATTAANENLPDAERDFAVLVRNRAAQLLSEGALKVTASHGIAAQALLDRRAEKEADRNLALNMARLLSGAISLPPMEVIEGRAMVVPPADVTPLLAPPEVIEPRT